MRPSCTRPPARRGPARRPRSPCSRRRRRRRRSPRARRHRDRDGAHRRERALQRQRLVPRQLDVAVGEDGGLDGGVARAVARGVRVVVLERHAVRLRVLVPELLDRAVAAALAAALELVVDAVEERLRAQAHVLPRRDRQVRLERLRRREGPARAARPLRVDGAERRRRRAPQARDVLRAPVDRRRQRRPVAPARRRRPPRARRVRHEDPQVLLPLAQPAPLGRRPVGELVEPHVPPLEPRRVPRVVLADHAQVLGKVRRARRVGVGRAAPLEEEGVVARRRVVERDEEGGVAEDGGHRNFLRRVRLVQVGRRLPYGDVTCATRASSVSSRRASTRWPSSFPCPVRG